MNVETRAETLESRLDILAFSELMKPELTGLSVLTAVCAFYLASDSILDWSRLFYTGLGTLLVGGAAGTLNQYIERGFDGMMKRTEKRPLPSARLSPFAAFMWGIILSFTGLFTLLAGTNSLAFCMALLTLTSYLFLYTPLKRVTPLNTVIGAIPGSLPVLIGWTAARNDLSWAGIVFFGILFSWQIPHFLSLGWMYRKDYDRAGFKMLPVMDQTGIRTADNVLWFTAALLPLSVALTIAGLTGYLFLAGAIISGLFFLYPAVQFSAATRKGSVVSIPVLNQLSRKIFFGSLAYLPILMTLMVLNKR